MAITSNLTTLNVDGENSSSDGQPHDNNDQKYLNQFRKR